MSEKIQNTICEFCGRAHSSEYHLQTAEKILRENNKDRSDVERAEQEGPATLDIIKIDGRWGQVFSPQVSGGQDAVIRWLDDMSGGYVNLRKSYILKTYYNSHVQMFRHLFSDTQVQNIHWGDHSPEFLKNEVAIFGEYISKNLNDKLGDNTVEKTP
ncbi:MAG: hypothetical protein AAB638_00320 [Patescibacteria group bacterium]